MRPKANDNNNLTTITPHGDGQALRLEPTDLLRNNATLGGKSKRPGDDGSHY